ncbi:MAG: enoyl-CoA hydratase-related protein [Sphingobium sp.]
MADALVTLGVEDGLATITLTRPEAGNAMSWDFIAAFTDTTQKIADDASVRAVLIEAQGKNFCVGGDIRAFATEADPSGFIRALATRLHEGVLRLANLPAPVVIAVQGAAAGAGLSLVAGGDVVIGGRSSSYSMAYTGIGLTADGGATWLLPRLIGLRRTQELAYLGRRLNAEEAERYGLLTRVVEDDALVEEARTVARKLASGPTHAYGQVKRLLAEADLAPLGRQLESEADAIGVAMATGDAQGAIQSFLARQAPSFTGR